MKLLTTSFLDFVDSRAVVRRSVLAFTLFMTWFGVDRAWVYALAFPDDKLGVAAVITAILVPITALQGFAFSQYVKGKAE